MKVCANNMSTLQVFDKIIVLQMCNVFNWFDFCCYFKFISSQQELALSQNDNGNQIQVFCFG